MRTTRTLAVALAAVVLLVAACGGGDSDTAAKGDVRTVEVDMVDVAFEPDRLEVERGETIRFVFINRGEVAHDAFLGDRDAQADHDAEMREADEGHGGHMDEVDAVTVEPGDTEELTYTFADTGALEIGCHQPGHYDAGMKIILDVA